MSVTDADAAARLLERILTDPAFRARFRRDPADACREAGLESLAEEMSLGAGKAMHTLDLRESRSSLAGVLMAAAFEGVSVYQFSEHLAPHLDEIPAAIGDVLSRVNLPALQGALASKPPESAARAAAPVEEEAAPAAASAGAPVAADEVGSKEDKPGEAETEKPGKEGAKDPAKDAAADPVKDSGDDRAKEPPDESGDQSADAEDPRKLPDSPPLPEGTPAEKAGKAAAPEAPAQPASPAAQAQSAPAPPAQPAPAAPGQSAPVPPAQPAPAPAADPVAADPVQPAPAAGDRPPIDPAQFGQEGKGGEPSPEAVALLSNKNVVLDDVGVKDIKAGRIDPRVIAVLTKLSQEHKITVSCMCSDHSKFTAGGSISNHFHGRGLDIAAIDGQPVNASNITAREIATALVDLPPDIRPNEIGTPWNLAGPGYFTDAGHQDHLHVGFKQPIDPSWTPPTNLAAANAPQQPTPVAPAAPAATAPAAAKEAVPTEPARTGDSLVMESPAALQSKAADKGDSLAFVKAVEPAPAAAANPAAPAPAAAAAADPAAPGAVDVPAGVDAYPGDNASKEQIAAWMATEAKKRGLPPELPIMASLVESGMRNLPGGDADSVGYFQMRVGIWNQGEYAGYPDKPELQIKWFLDTAETVKKQRVSRGQPIDDPSQYGEWIADVENPAAQYRGRYQLQLDEAQNLLRSAANQAPAAGAAPVTPPTEPARSGAPAAPVQPASGQAAPAADVVAPATDAARRPVDPAQFGQEGKGGPPSPEAQALLTNKNVVLDDVGVKDIKAGRIDPRVIAVLTKLSQEHKITVSCMCSDHSKFTAGGSISNHFHGRGLDIAAIDGIPVNASNFDAREIATNLVDLPADIRPDEIGTPWAIAGPGYFTDAGHQDHLHVGFKQPIDPSWTPPTNLAATPAAAAPTAPPAAAAAPVTPPTAPARTGDSLVMESPVALQSKAADKGDSLAFIKAAPPQPAPAAAAVAEPAAVDVPAGADAYPGDNASKEQIAAWMATEAKKRGLPPELPIMASLVESGMRNLPGGDADSVGFFQMRVGIWNQGEYAGYPEKPELQIKWFLDTAEAVKKQRVSRGQAIDDPSQFGEWIADVERPAAQYRGRYQPQLDQARALLRNAASQTPAAGAAPASGTAAAGSAPAPGASATPAASASPTPGAPAAAPTPAAPAAPVAADVVTGRSASDPTAPGSIEPPPAMSGPGPRALKALEEARKYMGTPYKWGGSTPETGFDCSGLVQWAYAQAGIKIPRVTDDQIETPNAVAVRRSELRPGDLVFFRDPTGYVYHVGMSLGGDRFLHAPRTGDVVKESSLTESYFNERFTGGRRLDTAAPAAPAAPVAAPAAAPAIPPAEVAAAQEAVARDAAEVRNQDSMLFKAVKAQEARKRAADSLQFLKAIDPAEAKAAAAPPPAPPPPVPPPAADPVQPTPPPAPPATPSPDLSSVAADYPGNDASKEALAKWLAKEAEKNGLPPELPVMAALVESGVRNLSGGDRDSVGFFQMRVGFWNQGKYAGYPDKPELQIKWFVDQALAVKKKRVAAGDADFGSDPAKWGNWIADVELPAEQFRGRYQLQLEAARALLRS